MKVFLRNYIIALYGALHCKSILQKPLKKTPLCMAQASEDFRITDFHSLIWVDKNQMVPRNWERLAYRDIVYAEIIVYLFK